MSDTYNRAAEVERDEDGRYVVAFPDFGWGATDGAIWDEALAQARGLLRGLIAATMREGADLPDPSRAADQQTVVVPPVSIWHETNSQTLDGERIPMAQSRARRPRSGGLRRVQAWTLG